MLIEGKVWHGAVRYATRRIFLRSWWCRVGIQWLDAHWARGDCNGWKIVIWEGEEETETFLTGSRTGKIKSERSHGEDVRVGQWTGSERALASRTCFQVVWVNAERCSCTPTYMSIHFHAACLLTPRRPLLLEQDLSVSSPRGSICAMTSLH